MILIDTDVWIDFFAGADPGAQAVERLLAQRRAGLSVISVFELFCGARSRRQVAEIETLVSTVQPIDLTPGAARSAGESYVRLRSQGRLIGNQDQMLGAAAAELGIPVLTRNRDHFERIEGLAVLSPEEVLAE